MKESDLRWGFPMRTEGFFLTKTGGKTVVAENLNVDNGGRSVFSLFFASDEYEVKDEGEGCFWIKRVFGKK